jgi:GntR family transcriptional regulator
MIALDLNDMRPLDPSARLPLYAQLAERLSAHIRRFQDKLAGRLLPSEAELTAHFGVSRPTVRQAMSELLSEGLITRGRGRGTFVAPPHASRDLGGLTEFEFQPPGEEIGFRLLERQRIRPTPSQRELFRLPPDEPIERITRLRLVAGTAFALEERFLPMRIAAKLADEAFSRDSGLVFIRRFIGKAGQVAFRFRAVPASAEQAKLLGMKRGGPLLSSEHTYFDSHEIPVLHGAVLFRGDRYDFGFRAPVRGAPTNTSWNSEEDVDGFSPSARSHGP